ncbi:MAG: hypothetical protein E7062_06650 [Spirochaetaceae bacterium]|nr:hypothetical protein [Spirochaetaceae bacterium]
MKTITKFCYRIIFFTSFTFCFSQTEAMYPKRGNVALVLSGGGAKGFAQIPILEMIEEIGIPIDLIIGTSVGAIVGSLYGAGYSPQEIHEKTRDLNWASLFNDASLTKTEQFLQNRPNNTLLNLNFSEKVSLKLGNSLSQGQNVYNLLRTLLCKIPSNISFYDLPIPTIITGTNLFTGQQDFFTQGDLADCIRASISIPGFFDFAKVQDTVYIDGGTLNNLPIQYAKRLGFEFIIAINIGEQTTQDLEKFDSSPFVALMQIMRLGQSTHLQNELKIADLLITPDMKEYTFLSFNKGKAIYQAGQESAQQAKESLIALKKAIYRQNDTTEKVFYPSQTDKAYKKQNYLQNPQLFIKTPVSQEEDVMIKKIFSTSFFSKKDFNSITEHNLNKFIQEVYKTGNYAQITTHILPKDDKTILEVNLIPKKDRNLSLNFGLNYSGLYGATNQSQFLASTELQIKNLTSTGSLLATGLSCINGLYAHLFYVQPVFKNSFFESGVYYKNYKKGIYPGFSKTSGILLHQDTLTTYLGFHYRLTENQQFSLGSRYNFLNNYQNKSQTCDFSLLYSINTLKKSTFSEKGFTLIAKTFLAFPLAETTNHSIQRNELFGQWTIPLVNKFSLSLKGFMGCNTTNAVNKTSSRIALYGFSVGDESFLLQIPSGLHYCSQKLAANTSLYYQPVNELTIFGGNLYLLLSASLCYTSDSLFNFDWKNPHWNSSLGIALEIKKNFTIISHLGVGSYEKKVYPFITLTLGSFYY